MEKKDKDSSNSFVESNNRLDCEKFLFGSLVDYDADDQARTACTTANVLYRVNHELIPRIGDQLILLDYHVV